MPHVRLGVIRYVGGQGSKLSDVRLAPKATDNRLEATRREGPTEEVEGARRYFFL